MFGPSTEQVSEAASVTAFDDSRGERLASVWIRRAPCQLPLKGYHIRRASGTALPAHDLPLRDFGGRRVFLVEPVQPLIQPDLVPRRRKDDNTISPFSSCNSTPISWSLEQGFSIASAFTSSFEMPWRFRRPMICFLSAPIPAPLGMFFFCLDPG